jgi:Cu/Ag efflux protein CusF
MKAGLRLAVGALAAMLLATAAEAATIIGLVDGKTLVWIDPATKKVTGKADIAGAGPILGIDVRPADGALYGLAADGTLVTIDPKTGKATVKSKLSEMLKPGGTVTFDFNPAADRLRLMSSDGTSFRINVDDGKVTVDGSHKFKDGDVNAGKRPKVVAGAYSNSFKGTTATALYNIDATTWTLVSQAPPNDGVLNTIGALGITVSGPVAFNIVASSADKNEAWLLNGGTLYSVDLKSGKATLAGKVQGLSGALTDIAWIDE